jgi:hypothetical protein
MPPSGVSEHNPGHVDELPHTLGHGVEVAAGVGTKIPVGLATGDPFSKRRRL